MTSAYVSEIYPSIQGEGPYTGERQIFFRLAGCPLRCDYCDTPGSLTAAGHIQMTVSQAVDDVLKIKKRQNIGTVSVTGGEPLAHTPFLEECFPKFKSASLKIYLETAGVHPDALKRVVNWCDVISMDVKLPSATGKEFWAEHAQFLRVAKNKVFAKIVVTDASRMDEFEKAVRLLADQSPPPILVIQPVTPVDAVKPPAASKIADFFDVARRGLPDVRIMPQQHKLWNVR